MLFGQLTTRGGTFEQVAPPDRVCQNVLSPQNNTREWFLQAIGYPKGNAMPRTKPAVVNPPNWANKTIWTGDNLYIMRGMNSASVDLIYLDPPFNSKTDYAAPIGSQAAGAAFKDTWTLTDIDVEWINLIEARFPALYRVLLAAMIGSDKSYLAYMAARLLEMRRILKPSGSIYLHCDPTMSHYLKLVLDAIFGRRNFRDEIIWNRPAENLSQKKWRRSSETLLYYSGGGDLEHPLGTANISTTSGCLCSQRH